MTDPIQAAIEKAEEACPCRSGKHQEFCHSYDGWANLSVCKCNRELMRRTLDCLWLGHAAIRSLAALVREYGHIAGCGCKRAYRDHLHDSAAMSDPRCLPESREEK